MCGHDEAAAAGASAAASSAPARSASRGSAAMAAAEAADRDLGRQVVEGSGSGGVGLGFWGGREGSDAVLAEATGRRAGYSQSQGVVRSQEVGGSLAQIHFGFGGGQARRAVVGWWATAAGASHRAMPVGNHERVATALRAKKIWLIFLRSF